MKLKRIIILIYRVLIVVCSVTGMLFLQLKHGLIDYEKYVFYTFQSNIIVTIFYALLVIKGIKDLKNPTQEGSIPHFSYRLHEVITFTITVTFLIFSAFLTEYLTMIEESLRMQIEIGSTLVHYVVPLMVIFDYFFHVRNPHSQYRLVLYNLIFPFAYFLFAIVRAQMGGPLHNSFPIGEYISSYPYPFIDIDYLGLQQVLINALVLLGGFSVLGGLIVFIDRRLYYRYPHHVVEWLREARKAKVKQGCNFAGIDNRSSMALLPWNYNQLITSFLKPDSTLLTIGSNGGELLRSIKHDPQLITLIESSAGHNRLCQKILTPLGIHIIPVSDYGHLSFSNDSFDILTSQFNPLYLQEYWRILKPGGLLITVQLGHKNAMNLSIILSDSSLRVHNQFRKDIQSLNLEQWEILDQQETVSDRYFYDTGAVVYYAAASKEQFPNFNVRIKISELEVIDKIIKSQGYITSIAHHHLLIMRKRVKTVE
ncbi:MAG: Pr6Pr family membrane protein [Bacilli bacterium]